MNHLVSIEFLTAQGAVNRRVRRMEQGTNTAGNVGEPPNGLPNMVPVILNNNLAAASHSKRGVKGKASICTWDDERGMFVEWRDVENDPEGAFEPDDIIVDVWNHSEHSEHDEGTFGLAIWAGWPIGHYWFFGDCEAMDEREAPVDEEGDT